MPGFGSTTGGDDDVTPCPLCGADAVAEERGSPRDGPAFVCDECGYEPSPEVVHGGRSGGLAVTFVGVGVDTSDERRLGIDGDALVARSPSTSARADVRVPIGDVTWRDIAVEEDGDDASDVVRVPRAEAPDLRVAPADGTSVVDLLLLLRTADPSTYDEET